MFGSKKNEPRFQVAFPAQMERKTASGPVLFRVHVQGYFTPKGGSPSFVAERIDVDGLKDMNIRAFFPEELNVLTEWTLKNVWPDLTKYRVKP